MLKRLKEIRTDIFTNGGSFWHMMLSELSDIINVVEKQEIENVALRKELAKFLEGPLPDIDLRLMWHDMAQKYKAERDEANKLVRFMKEVGDERVKLVEKERDEARAAFDAAMEHVDSWWGHIDGDGNFKSGHHKPRPVAPWKGE